MSRRRGSLIGMRIRDALIGSGITLLALAGGAVAVLTANAQEAPVTDPTPTVIVTSVEPAVSEAPILTPTPTVTVEVPAAVTPPPTTTAPKPSTTKPKATGTSPSEPPRPAWTAPAPTGYQPPPPATTKR